MRRIARLHLSCLSCLPEKTIGGACGRYAGISGVAWRTPASQQCRILSIPEYFTPLIPMSSTDGMTHPGSCSRESHECREICGATGPGGRSLVCQKVHQGILSGIHRNIESTRYHESVVYPSNYLLWLSGPLHNRKSTRIAKQYRLIFLPDEHEQVVYLVFIDHREHAYD